MIIPAALLLALSATSMLKADWIVVWKLSILATEFGHWFALLALAHLILAVVKKPRNVWAWTSVGFLAVSFFLFVRPAAQAFLYQKLWKTHLDEQLSVSVPGPLVTFKNLWIGKKPDPIEPLKIIYSQTSQGNLSLDFYPAASPLAAPFVVVVHTGGWDSGTTQEFLDYNYHLSQQGIAVAVPNYRLAPDYKWPAQRDDIWAAVKYLKDHAHELGLDKSRWALIGRSAGGQIAQAAAYQKKDATLKGLIAFYAPADLEFAYTHAADKDIINSKSLLVNLLGGHLKDIPQKYYDASPIRDAGRQSPPTLLFHGSWDPLTWNAQSRRLLKRLHENGGKAAFIELPWATHAFDFSLKGPGGQIAAKASDAFLAKVFK